MSSFRTYAIITKSTPLEALEKLRQNNKDNSHLFDDELLDIVEEGLIALNIIKEKRVDVCYFMNCETLEEYNNDVLGSYAYDEDDAKQRMLIQKEWELLKEILK